MALPQLGMARTIAAAMAEIRVRAAVSTAALRFLGTRRVPAGIGFIEQDALIALRLTEGPATPPLRH